MLLRLVQIVAPVLLAVLVFFSVYQGWARSETDFPNYYTAAVLVRKGEKLRNYYDWTYFQRQMNFAGIERQLGGYIPQTPLTMLPIVPIARFAVQPSKRIWLVANIAFLITTIWLLSRITKFGIGLLAALTITGYGSLHVNFLLGQYYIFLLFLLTLAFYCLHRKRGKSSGLLLGLAFALKLYGGPFILYFAAKRSKQVFLAMFASIGCLVLVAVSLFGWQDILYFAGQILPRALQGETLDPYNPGNGTFSTLLRRIFLREPELNPNSLFSAPWLFFFLQPFCTLIVLGLPLLAVWRLPVTMRDLSWFLVATLLGSPNTASYTFVLLLLPISILLEEAGIAERIALIFCYGLLSIPMRPSWNWFFPKVWLLLVLYVVSGWPYWRRIQWKSLMIGGVSALFLAMIIAARSLFAYWQEPAQHWERIAVQRSAIYSSSPVVLQSGIVYESIGLDRYVLRWLHKGQIELFPFDGEAFHPVALSPNGPIKFELVTQKSSKEMLFDLNTRTAIPIPGDSTQWNEQPVISPDGQWIAFTQTDTNAKHIELRKHNGSVTIRLTGGNCNSVAPAWQPDSKALIFASDCGRGIGLTALYRAQLDKLQEFH